MKDIKKYCILIQSLDEFKVAREFLSLMTRLPIHRNAERFEAPHYLCVYSSHITALGASDGNEIVAFNQIDSLADTPKRKEILAIARFRATNPDNEI